MKPQLTELTRREIIDNIGGDWNGRMDEPEFVSRLVDMDSLPSYDSRFSTFRQDHSCHRVSFPEDWDDHWIYQDERIGLNDDVRFLQFVAETLHPLVVRHPDIANERFRIINGLIREDGYELYIDSYMSGRPIYKARILNSKHSSDLYNLLVTSEVGLWDNDTFCTYEIGRFLQYTDDGIRERLRSLSKSAKQELCSFPTLFMYEIPSSSPARLGRIVRISTLGNYVRVGYELEDNAPALPENELIRLAGALDIGPGERSRTHWSVKEADLLEIVSPLRRSTLRRNGSLDISSPPAFDVPGYNLKEIISSGGFGTVYRAETNASDVRFVHAIKIHDVHPFAEPSKAYERFLREINLVQKLRHRSIVSYINGGFIESASRPYLVMEYIDGAPLGEAAPNMSLIERIEAIVQVLEALVHAHSINVLHRDIKPSNIMVRKSDGQSLIIDFGQGYILEEATQESLTTRYIGSAGYIPPEVLARPKTRTLAHDIFSCGVVLYEIIAGRRPIVGDYHPLGEINREWGYLDPIIRQALAPQKERYSTAGEFLEALRLAVQYQSAPTLCV